MTQRQRVALRVTGVVQGVGFRPFASRLARSLGVAGHVGNDAAGVFIEAEGDGEDIEVFTARLVEEAPPLARIASCTSRPLPPTGEEGFAIVASRDAADAGTFVAADLAPCRACLAELADPTDRRHRYPLLNCTDCGPRFTITTGVPFDRATTTMAGFPMCARCRAEYDDPADRRHHAQPTACPTCGPSVWVEAPAGQRVDTADPVAVASAAVRRGDIVAVKGVGGYHLACRADTDGPVALLRARKQRPDKPLAVMVADLATARSVALVDDAEAALLTGPERPVVLLTPRDGGAVSPLVAGGTGTLGVMLPPSPLHVLLIAPGDVWVMTSGNRSTEPICTDDDDARARLGGIADVILGHDRPIAVPCDDSVMRVIDLGEREPLPIRRSRGYAPYPVPVSFAGPPVLAVGGELKATLCLTRDHSAILSQHVGDVSNLETLDALGLAAAHLTTLFRTDPEVLACDAHPGYLSARWAREHAEGRPVVAVQHHHAHLASLMAEHRIDGPIIGFAFDGTGFGTDGTIWGGEVLVADLRTAERVGHLRPALLPGGDAAVRRPSRQALARLLDADVAWEDDLPPVAASDDVERRILARQLERAVGCVPTSSMGRLFDAVAALAGVRQVVTYEGQAAMELEAVGRRSDPGARCYPLPVDEDGVWDTRPLLRAIVDDIRAGVGAAVVSARFHRALVLAMCDAAERVRRDTGLTDVGVSGGVFSNVVLTTLAHEHLAARGFTVRSHRVVPANDGGLALGQAAIAAHTN